MMSWEVILEQQLEADPPLLDAKDAETIYQEAPLSLSLIHI